MKDRRGGGHALLFSSSVGMYRKGYCTTRGVGGGGGIGVESVWTKFLSFTLKF